MRCQICNRETNNFVKNKKIGKYESICSKCNYEIIEANRFYTDFDEDLIDVDMSEEEFLDYLKEVDKE